MTAYPVPGIQETHSKYFHNQANVFIQDCGVDPGVGTTEHCFVTEKNIHFLRGILFLWRITKTPDGRPCNISLRNAECHEEYDRLFPLS